MHADHLTGANYLKSKLPNAPKTGIGKHVLKVQSLFQQVFNWNETKDDFVPDGRQFDLLFDDGHTFSLGSLTCKVVHSPGHTPACVCYVVGNDAVFTGNTLFIVELPNQDLRLQRVIRQK